MIALFGFAGFMLVLFIAVSMVMSATHQAVLFDQPVDCVLGENCYIQNYVDLDPSKGWLDYTCGPLSYDGHKGTDFRLRNLVQMRDGVTVLAAAKGTVLRHRDGMPDVSVKEPGAVNIAGRECGNGVVIEHAKGWQTQYCHLKQGSILVQDGQEVERGQPLGEIGLSGGTEFPHLHFQITDPDGKIVDPFSGRMEVQTCDGEEPKRNLWTRPIREAMQYRPSGLLSHGFTGRKPTSDGAREGRFNESTIAVNADPFIFWVDAFGLREGDELIMQLIGPDNVALVNHSKPIEGNKAQYFQFVGKRLTLESWPEGTYRGVYRVVREEKSVINETFTIDIADSNKNE